MAREKRQGNKINFFVLLHRVERKFGHKQSRWCDEDFRQWDKISEKYDLDYDTGIEERGSK